MSESALTQEVIDHGDGNNDHRSSGLYAKAKKHPIVAGGALLVGAGLTYAVVKAVQSAADTVAREVHVETSIMIDRSPEELYAFWRDFKNLPLFMKNLVSVEDTGANRSHWIAKSINGTVAWDAEIFNEKPNELIAWRTLESSDVVNAGSVRFQKAPQGHGSYLKVTVNYNPPGGKIAATIAQLLGGEPAQLIREDLRRLKQLMETGEIATIDGQSSGRAATAETIETSAASPVTTAQPGGQVQKGAS